MGEETPPTLTFNKGEALPPQPKGWGLRAEKKMKIAIIGYGKMGRMIEKVAQEKGHQVVSIIDPEFNNSISSETLGDAEVCFEFTKASSVVENISQLVVLGKNVVVGTTGWEDHIEGVRGLVEKSEVGLFYASNFSVGMNLFIKVLQEASKRIVPTELYDVAGVEAHHNQKLDAPSGSAKMIAESLDIEVPFSSIRCGSIPGTHTVIFDSPVDTITLTHTARSREGFAQGAITAAEWLQGRAGFYTMEDMLFSGEKVCNV